LERLLELQGLVLPTATDLSQLLPLEDSDSVKVLPHQDLETLSVRLLDEPSEGILGLDLVALAEIKETFLKLNPLLALLVEAAGK
jgi:hypothetical protein